MGRVPHRPYIFKRTCICSKIASIPLQLWTCLFRLLYDRLCRGELGIGLRGNSWTADTNCRGRCSVGGICLDFNCSDQDSSFYVRGVGYLTPNC